MRYEREHTHDADGQLISTRTLVNRVLQEQYAKDQAVGRARYNKSFARVPIQSDDAGSDTSGFDVGSFYQMQKLASSTLDGFIKALMSGEIAQLYCPIVCVRI